MGIELCGTEEGREGLMWGEESVWEQWVWKKERGVQGRAVKQREEYMRRRGESGETKGIGKDIGKHTERHKKEVGRNQNETSRGRYCRRVKMGETETTVQQRWSKVSRGTFFSSFEYEPNVSSRGHKHQWLLGSGPQPFPPAQLAP